MTVAEARTDICCRLHDGNDNGGRGTRGYWLSRMTATMTAAGARADVGSRSCHDDDDGGGGVRGHWLLGCALMTVVLTVMQWGQGRCLWCHP